MFPSEQFLFTGILNKTTTNNKLTTTNHMHTPDKYEVAFAMQKSGTPFIKALAVAIIHANDSELRQIRMAFRKEWVEYSENAKEIFRKMDKACS